MIRVDIKPLSVNDAWQGRRFKTNAYKKYERDLLFLLPKITIPQPPFVVNIEYGFSSNASDVDNPTKLILDILQKKYLFNDSQIHELHLYKKIVKKGQEYFKFSINSFELFREIVVTL